MAQLIIFLFTPLYRLNHKGKKFLLINIFLLKAHKWDFSIYYCLLLVEGKLIQNRYVFGRNYEARLELQRMA